MSLTKELTKAILRAIKIDWVNSFIKLHCYLTKGFEWGVPPLLNRALLDWSSQTQNFKFRWNGPLLNYTVI